MLLSYRSCLLWPCRWGEGGGGRSQPRGEHLLREALALEKQLSALIARRIHGDTLHMIHQLRLVKFHTYSHACIELACSELNITVTFFDSVFVRLFVHVSDISLSGSYYLVQM